jgi:hypothetical protein
LKAHLWILFAAGLAAAGAAGAQPLKGVAFAGGSVGEGVSAYAGAVTSLPGAALGKGLALRASVNGGRYRYVGGPGRVQAEYVGAEAALVYQTSGDWGWANFSAGPRFTDISLSPADPENKRQGTRVDAAVQTDGGYGMGDWRLGWIASLGILDEAYQGRLQLGRLVSAASQTRLGVEAGVQGDPYFTTVTVGAFAGTQLANNLEAQLSAGISEQAGRGAKPYVSLGFSKLF